MSKENISKYNVAKLFKMLSVREGLNKDITLHLPKHLYDKYVEVLSTNSLTVESKS